MGEGLSSESQAEYTRWKQSASRHASVGGNSETPDPLSQENKKNRQSAIAKKGLARVQSEDQDCFPAELSSTPNHVGEKITIYETWKQGVFKRRGMTALSSLDSSSIVIATPSIPMVTKVATMDALIKSSLIALQPSKLSISSVGGLNILAIDATPPIIGTPQADGKTLISGDFITSQPSLTCAVSDETALGTWRIDVLDNQSSVVFTKSGTLTGTSGTVSAYVTPALNSGTYKVTFVVKDSSNNTSTKNITALRVDTGFKLSDCVNAPNPFNPWNTVTKLQYQLSQSADVSITIYSISGEKLWWQNYSAGSVGGSAGFNSVSWDGRSFGQVLANGPYIAYIVAQNGSKKSVGKIKLLILK